MPPTTPSGDSPFVQVRDLVREYRVGPESVRALDGIDLRVETGEFLVLLGVSGSGKSTLLQLLGGLDTPTSGNVVVAGTDLGALSPKDRALYRRKTVGFVFQAYHLVPSQTAEGNLAVALTFQGVFGKERRERAREALARVGLETRARHRPSQLSGGEQQRVALARALVHRPPLLLADEPTGNLDHKTAAHVLSMIREIQRDLGTTVVLVTHDEDSARRIADRVLRMRDGKILGEESAS